MESARTLRRWMQMQIGIDVADLPKRCQDCKELFVNDAWCVIMHSACFEYSLIQDDLEDEDGEDM